MDADKLAWSYSKPNELTLLKSLKAHVSSVSQEILRILIEPRFITMSTRALIKLRLLHPPFLVTWTTF